MSNDFAGMEGYRLQPQKSVSIQIKPKSTKMASAPVEYTLGKDQMPNVVSLSRRGFTHSLYKSVLNMPPCRLLEVLQTDLIFSHSI
jgi:hypothetical protein